VAAACSAYANKVGITAWAETDELDDEVSEGCRGFGEEGNVRSAKDMERAREWRGGVCEEIVTQFEHGLIVAAGGGGDASRCEDGNFRIDYEDVVWF
jgi:hypothetical protein